MFAVTGPVISRPSACRGDATNWRPKRPRSKTIVPRTLTSASQALQPPALTTRSFSERPNSRRSRSSSACDRATNGPRVSSSPRVRAANRYSCEWTMAPSGHACTHSGQKRQRPRSTRSPPSWARAPVGHASMHASHPSGHLVGSTTGNPRKRSGSAGGEFGNATVRCPCCKRATKALSTGHLSEVMAAVGEVEALVAEREVRDLLSAQRDRESHPVVKRGIDHLVARQAPARIGDRDVTHLAAPPLDEGHGDRLGRERPGIAARPPLRQRHELLPDERGRALDLKPTDVGACEDVSGVPRRDRHLREPVDARGELVANVALNPAGSGDRTHEGELVTDRARQRPRV